ncbi:MAG: hypothetical protein E7426_03105 [Ruminococcaceae bacterium]|jgi:membrane protein required for beta-lactamase induction|nr:hypothetical protein [Oscillospiraceae bacterium]
MSKKKETLAPLNRWQYFFKTLYHNSAATGEFVYDKRIYAKSEELQDIEQRSLRINYLMLLLLIVMFLLTSRFHNVWFVVIYMVLVVAGQTVRYAMLPKNIKDHLADTGRMVR